MQTPAPLPDRFGHFVAAQAPVWHQVLAELGAGRKASHWMWFVFPQLRGLGRSETARRYGLESATEAVEYLAHPVLGPRLVACTRLVLAVEAGATAHAVFGSPDDLKFRSCMTLFASAEAPQPAPPFDEALLRFFDGAADAATLALLRR